MKTKNEKLIILDASLGESFELHAQLWFRTNHLRADLEGRPQRAFALNLATREQVCQHGRGQCAQIHTPRSLNEVSCMVNCLAEQSGVDGHQAYGRGGWHGFEEARTNRSKQHPLTTMLGMLGKRLRIA